MNPGAADVALVIRSRAVPGRRTAAGCGFSPRGTNPSNRPTVSLTLACGYRAICERQSGERGSIPGASRPLACGHVATWAIAGIPGTTGPRHSGATVRDLLVRDGPATADPLYTEALLAIDRGCHSYIIRGFFYVAFACTCPPPIHRDTK